MKGIKMRMRFT